MMNSKKHILIRSKFMVPMSRKMDLSKRIHDGYVLTENETIRETGNYTEEKGEQIIRDCGHDLFIVGAEKQGDYTINVAVDAIERAMEKYPRSDPRHRIEHCLCPTQKAISSV